MSLTKAKGNMYEWCSHTHSYLTGKCPHGCKYCYVQAMGARFPNMRKRYSGPLALDRKQLGVSYDSPAIRKYAAERGLPRPVIFIEHMNDLWAETVPIGDIIEVLTHCFAYPWSDYVFQTKNPLRLLEQSVCMLPFRCLVGTTVECDEIPEGIYERGEHHCAPPNPACRLQAIHKIRLIFEEANREPIFYGVGEIKRQTFLTVEPIMKMKDPVHFASMIASANPSFVNVGADSKGEGLVEPTREELVRFLTALERLGVKVNRKTNLERLMR